MDRSPNSAPAYLQFYPTLRCNLSCGFCFNRHLPGIPDARPADAEKMGAICTRLGIAHIDLLGGEPTLHPGLSEIIKGIAGHGIRITMSSNGTRPDVLRQLSRQFPENRLRLGVSINSETIAEDLHAYIRNYRPILKSVFSGAQSPPAACRLYIGTPGIDYFLIYRDAADPADLENCASFEDYCDRLAAIRVKHPETGGVFCGGFVPDTRNAPELADVRCPSGTTKLSVLPDGSVFPCYLLFRYPGFYLGNILEDAFERIWHHPVLDFFRRFSGNPCPKHTCRFYGQCRGGCPAMSYLARGRLDAPDPRCVS